MHLVGVASEDERELFLMLLGVQGAKAESLTVWINALIASAGGVIIANPEARADWREAATVTQTMGWLTLDELTEVNSAVTELTRQNIQARIRGQRMWNWSNSAAPCPSIPPPGWRAAR